MSNTGTLEADMLFLGLTRQPMLFGVAYPVFILNFLICMFYFILTSDFKGFMALPLVHGAAYVACQKEPLFLELFMVRQQKCNKCANKFYHGMTNSYDVM
jgi:type IV secretion system protein VirB3